MRRTEQWLSPDLVKSMQSEKNDHPRFTEKGQEVEHPARRLARETLLHRGVDVRRGIQSLDGNGHIRCSSVDRPDCAVRLDDHHENHRLRGDVSSRSERMKNSKDRAFRLTGDCIHRR